MSAGNPELGGQVATATVPGHAAPSTPMNDPEKWEGRLLTLYVYHGRATTASLLSEIAALHQSKTPWTCRDFGMGMERPDH